MIRLLLLFCLIILFQGCDFSSQVHKDILAAQDHIRHQEYQKAIEHYEGILLKNPPAKVRPKILFQISDLYEVHLGQPQKSILHLQKILDETDDPVWVIKVKEKLGDIYFSNLHNFHEAAKQYSILTEFRPKLEKNDFYEFRLAQIYLELGKIDEAKLLLEKIKNNLQHENNVEASFYLGLLYFQGQKWQRAIDEWGDYLKREKRSDKIFEAKFLMANSYETMEKLDEAYQIYYSLLGKYPNTDVLRSRLKAIYTRKLARKR